MCNCPECDGYPNHMGVSLHSESWWTVVLIIFIAWFVLKF